MGKRLKEILVAAWYVLKATPGVLLAILLCIVWFVILFILAILNMSIVGFGYLLAAVEYVVRGLFYIPVYIISGRNTCRRNYIGKLTSKVESWIRDRDDMFLDPIIKVFDKIFNKLDQ